MNTEERRRFNLTFMRVLQDYMSNFQEYHENVTDYNRNISRMMNIIANNSNISLTSNNNAQTAQPQLRQSRRSNFEYDLLTYLLTTINPSNDTINPIGLSESAIENNTRMITYSENMEETRCPITHSDFESGEQVCQIIHCGHYFKREAIMRWFQTHNTCPTCRHVIRESRENNIMYNNTNNINTHLQNGLDSFARIINTTNIQDPSFNTISYTFDIPFNNYNT